jgi:hypothetical protein
MTERAPVAIFTIGTQGDIRPCVALGQGLRRAGYPVRIVTSDNFASLVRSAGLAFFPLTSDFQAMLEADRGIEIRKTGCTIENRSMRGGGRRRRRATGGERPHRTTLPDPCRR